MKLKVISGKEYKKLAREGFHIIYGFHPTQFGKCLVGMVDDAVCHLSFTDGEENISLEELSKEWPKAVLTEDMMKTGSTARFIFQKGPNNCFDSLNVLVTGTDFQSKVWHTLLTVPEGSVTHYENVANMIGAPSSVRASANAIAKNKVAFLLPCHRIISKSGQINSYRWGQKRKIEMLNSENPTLNLDLNGKKKIKF